MSYYAEVAVKRGKSSFSKRKSNGFLYLNLQEANNTN
jgi:hypothetical protein